jgi:Serine carboxypeptidase
MQKHSRLYWLRIPQVFSGDVDGIVPLAGTRRWIKTLNLGVKEGWRPWYTQSGTPPLGQQTQVTGLRGSHNLWMLLAPMVMLLALALHTADV